MPLVVNPEDCTVFIQIWIDINALAQQQVTGCYAVDNLQGSGEGTPSLTSKVATNTSVCWQVRPIDPQYAGSLTITQISAPTGWQAQPSPIDPSSAVWTGTVSKSSTGGTISQGITVNYNGGSVSWTGVLPMSVAIN